MLRLPYWNKHENAKSRSFENLRWVAVPNDFDGAGYKALVDHDDGAAHYGAWVALISLASRGFPRGTITKDDGTPYTLRQVARKTGMDLGIIEAVIPRLLNSEIGWLSEVPDPSDAELAAMRADRDSAREAKKQLASERAAQRRGTKVSADDAASIPEPAPKHPSGPAKVAIEQNRTEQNRTEQNGIKDKPMVDATGTGSGDELFDWFMKSWPGEKPANTWRVFGEVVTADTYEAFRANAPLWINCQKYQRGYAGNAVMFLRNRSWLTGGPPKEWEAQDAKQRGAHSLVGAAKEYLARKQQETRNA